MTLRRWHSTIRTITRPTLTPPQLAALQRIAVKNGAWGRALFDGTAEAFCAHRGGLRSFIIDREGTARAGAEIPPTERFKKARRFAIGALSLAAAGVVYDVLRKVTEQPIGHWWLWPVGCAIVAFLIAAAFFGIHARLPAPNPFAGEWVGLSSADEGDISGHTMTGLVRTHPFFCGAWLLFCALLGMAFTADRMTSLRDPFAVPLGGAAGAFLWWAIMLSFSRGWIREGD